MIVVVMGVSGSGKSTVGKALAAHFDAPFFDADDFHPPANVEKMSRGIPLDDTDRIPWLNALHDLLEQQADAGRSAFLACSALKAHHRRRLLNHLEHRVRLLYLQADFDTIHRRMVERTDHFMPVSLLRSQFNALEEPGEDALIVDAAPPADQVIAEARRKLESAAR